MPPQRVVRPKKGQQLPPIDRVYEPWAPPAYDLKDIEAVRACWAGTAMAHQQKRAIEYIMRVPGALNEMSFSPVDGRRTDFMEGRRYVGNAIRKFIEMPQGLIAKMRSAENRRWRLEHGIPKPPQEQPGDE